MYMIIYRDVKPENVMIFPRIGYQDAFIAKLTDFDHSIAACTSLTTLSAFTPQWVAPEVLVDHEIPFEGLVATRCVLLWARTLSILLGRSYYQDMPNYRQHRDDGNLLEEAMALMEKEDRENHDSAFELDTVQALLFHGVQLDSGQRSLLKCHEALHR